MWINLPKAEVGRLRKAIVSVGLDVKVGGPLDRLLEKLDEALRDDKNPVLREYRRRAKKMYKEGELEIDDDAVVSKGDDAGAYVQAWVWVEDEDDDKHTGGELQ
jgi:hypothetical protein